MKDNMRILIIDDDADDRMLFINAVKEIDKNINCIVAVDGQEALEWMKDPVLSLPDIIFLDLRMPGYNGKECLSRIKNDERLKHIPVIIYTTSKEAEESKELEKMGAFHFISKPSNAEEIYYLVSFVLEEQYNLSRKN